jgi:hypothetical protein
VPWKTVGVIYYTDWQLVDIAPGNSALAVGDQVKLTVIASLVLVPSFVVGFYGQNFAGEFAKGFWTIGVSTGLIVTSTLVQLALFRWRRWI